MARISAHARLGGGVRQDVGRAADGDAARGAGLEVDVVDADGVVGDDLQLRARVQQRGVDALGEQAQQGVGVAGPSRVAPGEAAAPPCQTSTSWVGGEAVEGLADDPAGDEDALRSVIVAGYARHHAQCAAWAYAPLSSAAVAVCGRAAAPPRGPPPRPRHRADVTEARGSAAAGQDATFKGKSRARADLRHVCCRPRRTRRAAFAARAIRPRERRPARRGQVLRLPAFGSTAPAQLARPPVQLRGQPRRCLQEGVVMFAPLARGVLEDAAGDRHPGCEG